MSRRMKHLMASSLGEGLADQESCVVVSVGPVAVEAMSAIRTDLREQGFKLTVVKNRVARYALAEKGWEPVGDLLGGTSALAYGEGGALVASKILVGWEKKSEKKLTIRGGFLDGKLLDEKDVRTLATIPDKPTLYAILASAVCAPVSQVASLVNEMLSGVARAVGAVADKQGGGA